MRSTQACRDACAEFVVHSAGSDDPRPIAAFASVPREDDLGPPPWLILDLPGGRLILPLTPEAGHRVMLQVTRVGRHRCAVSAVARVAFIDCVGARDEQAAASLSQALRARPLDAIRSLRRGTAPDDTAWCVGHGWWLSTADQGRWVGRSGRSQRVGSANTSQPAASATVMLAYHHG